MTVYEAFTKTLAVRTSRPAAPRRSVMVPIAIALATVVGVLVVRARALRREALVLGGIGMICASAWTYATWSGLLVTGLGLLWLEYLTSPADGDAGT